MSNLRQKEANSIARVKKADLAANQNISASTLLTATL
jgi:hypothetical protein